MIFTIADQGSANETAITELEGVDVFCFFPCHGVLVPKSLWYPSVLASLRIKKNVLILQSPELPCDYDKNQRILLGDNWIWLAPRSLNLISKSYVPSDYNLTHFRLFLQGLN